MSITSMSNTDDGIGPVDFSDLLPMLTPYGREFLNGEYGRGEKKYRDRISFIGLENQGRILDAGGGIGQWAIALARTNVEVRVLDLMADRLLIGNELVKRHGLANVDFQQGSIEAIPFADSSFDAIICYSVMMFADGARTSREFARVLKPSGKLYVMIDLWRWYVNMFFAPGKWRAGALFLAKSALGRGARFYTPTSFSKLLSTHGFEIISAGQDGHASFDSAQSSNAGRFSFYPKQAAGREHLWEVCAIRR